MSRINPAEFEVPTQDEIFVLAYPTEDYASRHGDQPVRIYSGFGLTLAIQYAATWYERVEARDMYHTIEVVWNGQVIATYKLNPK